jgi:hypothetical protein
MAKKCKGCKKDKGDEKFQKPGKGPKGGPRKNYCTSCERHFVRPRP